MQIIPNNYESVGVPEELLEPTEASTEYFRRSERRLHAASVGVLVASRVTQLSVAEILSTFPYTYSDGGEAKVYFEDIRAYMKIKHVELLRKTIAMNERILADLQEQRQSWLSVVDVQGKVIVPDAAVG